MAEAEAPKTPGAAGALTRKYGPLPGYAWMALAVVLAIAFMWYRSKSRAAAAAAGPSASSGVPSYPTTGDLAAAGLYQPPDSFYAGDIQGPQGLQGPPGVPGATTSPPSSTPPAPAPAPASPSQPAQATAPAATGTQAPAQRYVTVQKWPVRLSTLSGIAAANGITLGRIEQLNPQFSSNWNLLYAGEQVRVA